MDLLKIALTGGIASGKSVVARLFANKGIAVIDADKIARALFAEDSPYLADLKRKFGDAIFLPNGQLDRKALGKIVFNSANDLTWLNNFTHPKVRIEITNQLAQVTSPYVVIDIPLLVDQQGNIPSYLQNICDRVLVVDVDETEQLSRLRQRDALSRDQAQQIITSQASRSQRLSHADDTIDNNSSFEALESQVSLLHNRYLQLAAEYTK